MVLQECSANIVLPIFPHQISVFVTLHRWKIVIHGGIDGYSRRIMFLSANTNNRASTVLQCFLTAVAEHGLPQRVRSDKGGENVEVARFMLEHPERGPGRNLFHTGCILVISLKHLYKAV